jgi:hypothetical protein
MLCFQFHILKYFKSVMGRYTGKFFIVFHLFYVQFILMYE